jgi:phytoene/squalene synthetase
MHAAVRPGPAASIVCDKRFAAICEALAQRAQDGFARAETEIKRFDARALRPAAVMMWGYRRLLERLIGRGFALRGSRPRLTSLEKLRMAWMALGLGPPG